jgi:hypothetical protein
VLVAQRGTYLGLENTQHSKSLEISSNVNIIHEVYIKWQDTPIVLDWTFMSSCFYQFTYFCIHLVTTINISLHVNYILDSAKFKDQNEDH